LIKDGGGGRSSPVKQISSSFNSVESQFFFCLNPEIVFEIKNSRSNWMTIDHRPLCRFARFPVFCCLGEVSGPPTAAVRSCHARLTPVISERRHARRRPAMRTKGGFSESLAENTPPGVLPPTKVLLSMGRGRFIVCNSVNWD